VFQLNITTDHVKQMKDAGVYDTFRKLQDMFRAHPISDTAFGWVRWTGKPGTNPGDGVFVDEVQSDHFVPLAEKARAQAMRTYSDPAKAQEAGQRAFEKANSATPVEHQKKINQILFGGKHASEVLLEAFHQHLRDQGHAGTKIAIHSIHTKAPISLGDMKRNPDGTVDKKTLPGHFVEGYENVPKSMGMDPAQYHQDNMATQDSPALQDKPTFQDDLRKRMK
jgi:surface antigen